MTLHTFARYDLRTTDPDAARKFYAASIGLEFAAPIAVWPLHEQARARGVPAHWLGNISVDDVQASIRRVVELGGEVLGPVVNGPDGMPFAVIRDPLGAVHAIRQGIPTPTSSPIVWHLLHVKDVDRAWAIYSELFGWSHTQTVDMPELEGGHRLFAWQPGEKAVGSMANTARWPGVHVHWLYYLAVPDIDAAIAKVRENGGNALSPVALPSGERLVACEDPQSAAFGLMQLA